MRLFTRQPWILGLMLLMYIGQAVASVAVPCHLLSQGDEVLEEVSASGHQHHMHGMDHSAHAGASLSAIDAASESDREQGSLPQGDVANTALHDCCDAMSHCTSGNCSMSSLDENVLHATLHSRNDALVSDTDQSPARLAYSLYRPPILL
ncbi:MAG: hypothetical protein A3H44_09835 [Gammaproteobacteria bacterium RIFCSPLOWO2_02_FULL_57_10]|nr:MAG: hypothetical protein A3H44_09835 [Gammaproteobacteria bacterium RIFCSPLOWO2_02_FULL_57_10]